LGDTLEFDFETFEAGIRAFQITGLSVDATDPGAFPLFVNASTPILSFSQAPLVPDQSTGDFNDDGVVNAADYVTWRKFDGTQAGYDNWRINFGSTSPGSGSAHPPVPEPSAVSLLMLAALGWHHRRRRTAY
jgi:hypothetical protein